VGKKNQKKTKQAKQAPTSPPKAWTVEVLDDTVETELSALPDDMRAHFVKISELIEQHGLSNVHEPHVAHIEGKVWEMRLKGRSGIARAFYVSAAPKRVVVLRAFVKKTEKTPRPEIDLALERSKRVKDEEA
jgi:phage-related protein